MNSRIHVYISSPYTIGDKDKNVMAQIECKSKLMDLGFIPFAPLLSHYVEKHFPKSWEKWMEWDLEWVGRCDCIIRLEGESAGADMQVEFAKEIGIPVFYSIDALLERYDRGDKE